MCSKMCYTYVNNMLCSAIAFIYFSIVHPIIHHHIVHSKVPEMDISGLWKMQNSKICQGLHPWIPSCISQPPRKSHPPPPPPSTLCILDPLLKYALFSRCVPLPYFPNVCPCPIQHVLWALFYKDFVDTYHKHGITGNLDIAANQKTRT